MKIMGIDPGIRNCGVVVIRTKNGKGKYDILHRETIVTIGKSTSEKLYDLVDRIATIATNSDPDLVVIEDAVWYGKAKTGLLELAKAVGAVFAATITFGAPTRTRLVLAKEKKPVRKRKGWSEHERDALSLAALGSNSK